MAYYHKLSLKNKEAQKQKAARKTNTDLFTNIKALYRYTSPIALKKLIERLLRSIYRLFNICFRLSNCYVMLKN